MRRRLGTRFYDFRTYDLYKADHVKILWLKRTVCLVFLVTPLGPYDTHLNHVQTLHLGGSICRRNTVVSISQLLVFT